MHVILSQSLTIDMFLWAGALRKSGSIKSETDAQIKWGPVTYVGMTSFLENVKGKLCLFVVCNCM